MINSICNIGLFDDVIKRDPLKFAFDEAVKTVRDVIEYSLELELKEAVGCGRHERSPLRRDMRNGYYERGLNTRYGSLIISVPRLRKTPLDFKAFGLFERHSAPFIEMVVAAFAHGQSTRKAARFLKEHFGVALSAQGISNLVARIDREVASFHRRRLTEACGFMQIDGMGIMCGGRKMTALIALGFNDRKDAKVLSYAIVDAESKWECVAFLRDMENRGFSFADLELITHDDSGGIRAALEYVAPVAPTQLCVFHKLKNLRDSLSGSPRKERMMRQASAIYDAPEPLQARHAKNDFVRAWARWEGEAVKNFIRDFPLTTSYYAMQEQMRTRVRTNNPLERRIREIRRRTRPICAFKNIRSADRIIYLSLQSASLIEKHPENEFTHIS